METPRTRDAKPNAPGAPLERGRHHRGSPVQARQRIREEIGKVIVGQETIVDHMLVACSAAATSSCWVCPAWARP